MLPKTHHLIINVAIDHAGSWAHEFRQEILQGNDDEDVHIVPIVKWRLRAAGLTHTHVPNGRFGELGAPSAKRQCLVFLDKAHREEKPAQKAWWLGRACHVIADVAVPARAHRIWHIEGDPLEAWIESHCETFANVSVEQDEHRAPEEIIEELARIAITFPADTTRTPWGRAAFHWFSRGRELEEPELTRQARVLVPRAMQSTKALLEWFHRT
jgi:hypothetical protein